MFCSKCGYKLLDDEIFCGECGTERVPSKDVQQNTLVNMPKKKKSKYVLRFLLVFLVVIIALCSITFILDRFSVISLDRLLSGVLPVSMLKYNPLIYKERTYVGEYDGQPYSREISASNIQKVNGKNCSFNTIITKTNNCDNQYLAAKYIYGDYVLYLNTRDRENEAESEIDILRKEVEQNEGSADMPLQLMLGETDTYLQPDDEDADEPDDSSKITNTRLLDFETIDVNGKTYRHTAVVEYIFDNEFKEVNYYAKGIGMVEAVYYRRVDGEWLFQGTQKLE